MPLTAAAVRGTPLEEALADPQLAMHYGGVRALGPRALAAVQRWGMGVYYNPYVELAGRKVKYGVVEAAALVDDLTSWTHLYLAGRLHKPVAWIGVEPLPIELTAAVDANVDAALRASWIMLGAAPASDSLPATRIYEAIASLSYMGDPRFAVGAETPSKVPNIVAGNRDGFDALYGPRLDASPLFERSADGGWELAPQRELPRLPSAVARALPSGSAGLTPGGLASPATAATLASAIRGIVGGSAAKVQIAKGVVTAGVFGSIRYALEKLAKGRRR